MAVLFLDIRGFTALTTGQLPYDVVFLLNRFFDAIVPAITAAGAGSTSISATGCWRSSRPRTRQARPAPPCAPPPGSAGRWTPSTAGSPRKAPRRSALESACISAT
ncbi:hypothetical protein ACFSZS_05965 [Seohaeicola zhoushanensis]